MIFADENRCSINTRNVQETAIMHIVFGIVWILVLVEIKLRIDPCQINFHAMLLYCLVVKCLSVPIKGRNIDADVVVM